MKLEQCNICGDEIVQNDMCWIEAYRCDECDTTVCDDCLVSVEAKRYCPKCETLIPMREFNYERD